MKIYSGSIVWEIVFENITSKPQSKNFANWGILKNKKKLICLNIPHMYWRQDFIILIFFILIIWSWNNLLNYS